jgi:hypothetical protein
MGSLGSGLLVVEMQGFACVEPTAYIDANLVGIVDTASRSLSGVNRGGARLLTAYIMNRRPCDPAVPCDDGTIRDDDVCTVLCVAALHASDSSHWMALDMSATRESAGPHGARPRRGRKWFAIKVGQASLIECFTRHASINSRGVINRNEAHASGCASCAQTWRGFRPLLSQPRRRTRINTARVAALTITSLEARRSFRREAGLVDILCAGVVALKEVSRYMDVRDSRFVRGERALVALALHIENAITVCLWSERFGAIGALAIMTEAYGRAAAALPEDLPLTRTPPDVLDTVVGVAVAAGVIIARAKHAAAEILAAAMGSDVDVAQAPLPPGLGSCPPVAATNEISISEWGARATAFFAHARQLVADHAETNRPSFDPNTATGESRKPSSPSLPQPSSTLSRRKKNKAAGEADSLASSGSLAPCPPPSSFSSSFSSGSYCLTKEPTKETLAPPLDAPRCASAACRDLGRRITSGCVITAHCTADCRAAFHRACWRAMDIAYADGASCPTPDCWGLINEVTSARARSADQPPRLLWRGDRAKRPLDGSSETVASHPISPGRPVQDQTTLSLHVDERARDDFDSDTQHQATSLGLCQHDRLIASQQTTDMDHHSPPTSNSTPLPGTEDTAQSKESSDANGKPTQSLPMGGVPYQKTGTLREAMALHRKRPRNRTGRRQRRRSAQRQHERLLMLAGFDEISDLQHQQHPSEQPPPETLCPSDAYDDDSLWPPFFCP